MPPAGQGDESPRDLLKAASTNSRTGRSHSRARSGLVYTEKERSMQPIVLRSSERVKNIAVEVVGRLLPESWPHRTKLDVASALYGYDHWSHLRASVNPDAPQFVFDQDMSYDEFSERRVDIAKHVESRCPIPFPYAYELVTFAAVTRDFRREPTPVFTPEHDAYHRAMLELDWWWVCKRYSGHPLVTKGFYLCEALNMADLSREALTHTSNPHPRLQSLNVLLFEDVHDHSPFTTMTSRLFFKREEMLEIEPLPLAEMLARDFRADKAATVKKLTELYGRYDWAKRVVDARADYSKLAAAAGLPFNRNDAIALDIKARDVLRKPWYWPIKCRPGQRTLVVEYERLERAKWQT